MEIVILTVAMLATVRGAVINNVPPTGKSPTRPWKTNVIPYKWTGTDLSELLMLRDAMSTITSDSGNCITFQDVTRNSQFSGPFLYIAPTNLGTPSATCGTYHGYYPNPQENSGQLMVAFNSASSGNRAGACLDSKRDAMRMLMNAVGVRNEWQKSTRNQYMTFPPNRNDRVAASLKSGDFFNDNKIYAADQALDLTPGEFDANSLTMITPERFAASSSSPVFTMKNGLTVGNLAHLSLRDCQVIQVLYGCSSQCNDPYATPAGAVTFLPNPATFTRNLQCQNTISPYLPLPIGQLLIEGLTYDSTSSALAPTSITVRSTVPGLTGVLKVLQGPTVFGSPTTDCNIGVDASCLYSVKFTLSAMPTTGVTNAQITVNVNRGTVVIATLTATVNLNCAPVFKTLTATVGPTPEITFEKVYRYPTDITAVAATPASPTSPIISGAAAGNVAQYIVNYNTPNGIGDVDPVSNAPTQTAVQNKVYVNCAGLGAGDMAGTTVIGVVAASDPEGDPVSYYAYSGVTTSVLSNGVVSRSGELHTVTNAGVIAISAIATPAEADVLPANTSPAEPGLVSNIKNPNGGMVGPQGSVSGQDARDVFIVAVDSHGASSILQARFYLACGESI